MMIALSSGGSAHSGGSASALLLLADADGLDDLVVVPGADAVLVRAELGALAAEEVGEVVLVDQLEQVLLVRAALDRDLLARLLIQEAFDDRPHSREEHRRVHYESPAHDLRVVVRADLRCHLNEAVNLL